MSSQNQLYNIVKSTKLQDYFIANDKSVVYREAINLPFICFPDGKPCNIANAYMLKLYSKGLSTGTDGGSLKQYASNISPLIRYCFLNSIDFLHMTSDRFTLLINGLRAEKDDNYSSVPKRDSNTLNSIGRRCLDFLEFIGELNGDADFVKNAIQAEKKTIRLPAPNSRKGFIERLVWHHKSFDTDSPFKKRGPISQNSIDMLYEAVNQLSEEDNNRFLERRRVVLLRLLEMTGARVGELARIRLEDLERAFKQSAPMLRLITLKKGKEEEIREIPVLRQDLMVIKAFVRSVRAKKIRDTIGKNKDHGYLFISDTTGKPIQSRTLSNEIGLLRRASGINKKACAHMFRHRFITKLFVRLALQFDLDNKDEFRKALLSTERIKQEVQQYTGHGSISSIDHYVDLAFDEISGFTKAASKIKVRTAYESFDSNVEVLQRELEKGMPISVYLKQYEELIKERKLDIENAEFDRL